MTGATIRRNILYSSNPETVFLDVLPARGRNPSEDRRGRKLALVEDVAADHYIYFCSANPKLANEILKKNQSDGVDTHSQAVDPLFVDSENGDFRFQPNSPALKMGVIPIEFSKIGLLDGPGETK